MESVVNRPMYKLPINNSMPIPLMTENRKTSMLGIISAILLTIDKIKRAIIAYNDDEKRTMMIIVLKNSNNHRGEDIINIIRDQ